VCGNARDDVRATEGRTTGGYGSERLGDLTNAIELMAGNLEDDEKTRVHQLDKLQESVRTALIEHSDAESQAARMAIQAHELEQQANPNPKRGGGARAKAHPDPSLASRKREGSLCTG